MTKKATKISFLTKKIRIVFQSGRAIEGVCEDELTHFLVVRVADMFATEFGRIYYVNRMAIAHIQVKKIAKEEKIP